MQVSASSSITALAFATLGGSATATPVASLVADSEKIWHGSSSFTSTASISSDYIRIRTDTDSIVSVTSGTATIGREKWEIIVNDSVTWTQIAA